MPGGWWDSRRILRPSLGSQVCKDSGARVLGWEGQEKKEPKDKEERSQMFRALRTGNAHFSVQS